MDVIRIYQKLLKLYGPQGWWPVFVPAEAGAKPSFPVRHRLTYGIPYKNLERFRLPFRDPYFEIALGAILAQNVSWSNAAAAVAALYQAKALTPERVLKIAASDERKLEKLLIPTRYFAQKAKKVSLFCRWLIAEYGGAVQKLNAMPKDKIRAVLLERWGIGRETADSIMLYALNQPIFVVDIYTKRLCEKFGAVFGDYDEYQFFFESGVRLRSCGHLSKSQLYREYHALIVVSGQDKHARL